MNKSSAFVALSRCEAIGIDVSKATLSVAGLDGSAEHTITLPNTTTAIVELTGVLSEHEYSHLILCEATGHYHLNLAIQCVKSGLDLRIINPLTSSKHSRSAIRKTKTDPMDARLLATMCLTERRLPKTATLTPEHVRLQLLRGQLAALEKHIQSQRQSLHQYRQTCHTLGLGLTDAQQALLAHVEALARLKKVLEKEFTALAAACMDEEQLARLRSIPGFSASVSSLVGLLDPDVNGADAWVAYVGLDVSVRQSGTWTGRGKLTKRGNAYLRKRLFQAAWGACLNYKPYRCWYDQLKNKGRKHAEAVCIIARKLLRIAYHITRTKTVYDAEKVFGMPVKT